MLKNKTKTETKETKTKKEETKISIFQATQDALMCKTNEFKLNYAIAFKAIEKNMDLASIRSAIDRSDMTSIALKNIYCSSRNIFESYITQGLTVIVSSIIYIVHDFVINEMHFNPKQMELFREKFYSSNIIQFNQYGPINRYGNGLFNDMLNQVNRHILMTVKVDEKDEDEKKIDVANDFMSAFGFESISMSYVNSFSLDLYDYIFNNLLSISAFDTETMSDDKYELLLNFASDFLNDACLEVKKMYIDSLFVAMLPYAKNMEYAMMLGMISNALHGSTRYEPTGKTINVYPEKEDKAMIGRGYALKNNKYNSNK